LEQFGIQDALSKQALKLSSFNFKYFKGTDVGQSFKDWENDKFLADLMDKLKDFSSLSLMELQQNGRYKNYGKFPLPEKTDFQLPKDLPPNGIQWGSFRITGEKRLIGFVVSELAEGGDCRFLKNTFFVVFLDKNHNFWKSSKKHT
jgi:hypothetical protein